MAIKNTRTLVKQIAVGLVAVAMLVAWQNCGSTSMTSGASGTSTLAYSSVLTVYPSPQSVALSGSATFTVSGGTAPYTFTISSSTASSPGYFSPVQTSYSTTYIAPASAGTVTVTVTDSASHTNILYIYVGGATTTVGQYITAFGMTAEDSHSASGYCANGGTQVGTTEDCGAAKCGGVQIMCTAPVTSASATSAVMARFWMTQTGTHVVGGGGCPSGYTQMGSVADCGGGTCNGNQLFCAEFVTDTSANISVVKNIYVSPLGVHAASGPGCPSGYSVIGYVADCGGAVCSGYQDVCIEMGD